MGNSGHCGSNPDAPDRAHAAIRFRITTGHVFLGVYLHWLDLAADEIYPMCGYVRVDGVHLLQCTGLDEYPIDNIVS
ncbi:hypothetical protein TNCV_4881821 [Trichonephila clavipes]|nr:hypothetical protein TNCV_4881821 [Trichonephila clavipes]